MPFLWIVFAFAVLIVYSVLKQRRERVQDAKQRIPYVRCDLQRLKDLCEDKRVELEERGVDPEIAERVHDAMLTYYGNIIIPLTRQEGFGEDWWDRVETHIKDAEPVDDPEIVCQTVDLLHLAEGSKCSCRKCGEPIAILDEPYFSVLTVTAETGRTRSYCQRCGKGMGFSALPR